MRKRNLLLLVLVTAGFVAGAIYPLASRERAATPAKEAMRVLPHLAAKLGDLAWMRLDRGAMKADFTAIGGGWVVVEKANYPAAPARIRSLLLGLAGLGFVEPKTQRRELLGRLDLDDPANGKSTLVSLQDRMGETVAELVVGKSRPGLLGGGSDGVYVRKPGDDQAWLAQGSLDLSGDVRQWLDRHLLDIAPSRVVAVTLTAADGTTLALRRAAPGGPFATLDAPADTRFKDDAVLAAPAAALAGLELDDVRPAADLPAPQSGKARALFTTADGLAVTLLLFAKDGADWALIEASGSGAAAASATAINDKAAHWAYAIPADRARLLRTKLADLVAQKGS